MNHHSKIKEKELVVVATHAAFLLSHRSELLQKFSKIFKMTICVGRNPNTSNMTDRKKLEKFGYTVTGLISIFMIEFRSLFSARTRCYYIVGIRQIIMLLPLIALRKRNNYFLIISGLGNLYYSKGYLQILLKIVFESIIRIYSTKRKLGVIVQNEADAKYFREELNLGHILKVRGSGVDLDHYRCNWDEKRNEVVFLGRLIKEKGICEFISASKMLSPNHQEWDFKIFGNFYNKNPTSITVAELDCMLSGTTVRYCGYVDDPSEIYKNAKIVCVPSYHEGLPKTILEACAAGCAIVTTDARGCSEAITDRVHGVIVQTADIESLKSGLDLVISNDEQQRFYGMNSALLAQREFGIEPINNAIVQFVREALK